MENSEKNFWQSHSEIFLEMAFRSDRRERLSQPDGYANKSGDCGDTIEFYLAVSEDKICRLAFDTNGCIHTVACCNAIGELVEGKTLDAAWKVIPETVIDFLKSLPEDHHHCAELAVGTLYLALADSRTLRRHSWKKLYR